MARKRKKKTTTHNGPSAYKRYQTRLYTCLKKNKLGDSFAKFKSNELHYMFDMVPNILPAETCNKLLSKTELKKIQQNIRHKLLQEKLDIKGHNATVYDIVLMYSYGLGMQKVIARETGDRNNPEIQTFKELQGKLFTQFYSQYALLLTCVTLQLSNPTEKYISIKVRIAAIVKDNPVLDVVTELAGVNAKKSYVAINGNYRPIFQLGSPDFTIGYRWIKVCNTLLPTTHQTKHDSLSLHIQAHALRRLKERLNLLNTEALHYALWENTVKIKSILGYKQYLLLPFKLHTVKVGYMVMDVIEDKLICKTFLFITHNSTPEGDKLKQISGLGKHDISYWKIDRLSTFVNMPENQYPQLLELFNEAGLGELSELKNKAFDVETLQLANLDGLSEYISRGSNADQVQKQEFNQMLASCAV